MLTDHANQNFKLATDFINYTNRSVFLTGKAGTGKTTFLKYIKQQSIKPMAIVAPTGVAAINAGGVTIHSFFQLPFGPYIPEGTANLFNGVEAVDKHHLLGRLKITSERKKIFQEIELLVIDEISMVRADILDAIDIILKHFRSRYNEPFGGVQLLLIGDIFQLPPVVKQEDWEILAAYYASPYFFNSKIIEANPLVCIELTKVYRQKDEEFIHILNGVRNNNLDENGYEILHKQYQPNTNLTDKTDYITLTTHNNSADEINTKNITKIDSPIHQFKAEIKGDFSEKAYPADELLELKVGAQVMFIKNDVDKIKRYFNGKIGRIERIEDDKIYVIAGGETELIAVSKYEWENIRYSYNKTAKKVEEEVVGSFIQYPLRLAWAITIHKSQGLTFEKAIIDAGKAFAPGQVYVALSRCTSLAGMILLSKITPASLRTDERIVAFGIEQGKAVLPVVLQENKQQYQSKLLLELFSIVAASKTIQEAKNIIKHHANAFNEEAMLALTAIEEKFLLFQNITEKFELQLKQFLSNTQLPEEDELLQERIKKASAFYIISIEELLQMIQLHKVITEKKELAVTYNSIMENLIEYLFTKKEILKSCLHGFTVEKFQQAKGKITAPDIKVNVYASASAYYHSNTVHPELYKQLRILRDQICDRENLPIYYIANSKTLEEMANYLPQHSGALKKISGFAEAKIKKYGAAFLSVINAYCLANNLDTNIEAKPIKIKKEKRIAVKEGDSKSLSLELFKAGKSIATIAKERNFTTGTIESHLLFFVQNKELEVDKLVDEDKRKKIERALTDYKKEDSISSVKAVLGDEISYGEIRFVMAAKGLK